MKIEERNRAVTLRENGHSLNEIVNILGVSKSSVSIWVREVQLSDIQKNELSDRSSCLEAVELRRQSRLRNELLKREKIILEARRSVRKISKKELWLIGTMLYWAEGGKTQRLVRFSNGDPEMIKIMMSYFRGICNVPESKFRGYIHIHPHLDHEKAEMYWSDISKIPTKQFFKTYRKTNKSSLNKKDTLPHGVFDIYVMNTKLFYMITGWAKGIFSKY